MATYLVTGGAGFIGSNIARAWCDAGHTVRVLDNLSSGSWDSLAGIDVEKIEADVRDPAALAHASQGVEVVFHHAAIASVPLCSQDPVAACAVNVGGTVNVLDAARRAGARRGVFAGSAAVYGAAKQQPVDEEQQPNPSSDYGTSKWCSESYLSLYAREHGIDTVTLRYFNVFGPGQRPDSAYAAAIPRFAFNALRGQALTLFGDGEQTRDFCFIADVVRANQLAAAAPLPLGGAAINIASGRSVSLLQVIAALEQAFGHSLVVEHAAARTGDIRHSAANIEKARSLLGYEPGVRFERGLGQTIEYLRGLSHA